jgi:hypothetical protein
MIKSLLKLIYLLIYLLIFNLLSGCVLKDSSVKFDSFSIRPIVYMQQSSSISPSVSLYDFSVCGYGLYLDGGTIEFNFIYK